jgi:predicted RNase H-like nuclease (RuvC/YqgF family)
MVQSTPNANFAIIKNIGKTVEIENTPEVVKGWRVDQILNSEYFGFEHGWDSDTEALFKERRELLHNTKRSADQEARLEELEEHITSLPTENNPRNRKAMELIRKAADALKTNFKDKI